MWVNKYKAYLDVKCAKCGEELSAELVSTPVGSNNETVKVYECSCTIDKIEALDERIIELEEKLDG